MLPARVLAGVPAALVMLALSGCSSHWGCTDTTAERGEAAVRVEIEDETGQPLGTVAEVVDWRLAPHPQAPTHGDEVRFRFRFDGVAGTSGPAVDACAVDKERRALGCRTVYASEARTGPDEARTGDVWLDVERPGQVAEVLLVPNDQSYDRRTCEQDVKDGGGTHPPKRPGRGDRL